MICGDGELQEGVCWEGVNMAAGRGLDNLVVFVDRNGWQSYKSVAFTVGDNNVADRFRAFGWYTQCVNGHDVAAIDAAIDAAKAEPERPSVIVLDTIKGHGWSKTEGQVGSHSRNVTAEDLADALAEMQAALDELGEESK